MNNINNVLILLAACLFIVIGCLMVLIFVCKRLVKEITECQKSHNYNEIMIKELVNDFSEIKNSCRTFARDILNRLAQMDRRIGNNGKWSH